MTGSRNDSAVAQAIVPFVRSWAWAAAVVTALALVLIAAIDRPLALWIKGAMPPAWHATRWTAGARPTC